MEALNVNLSVQVKKMLDLKIELSIINLSWMFLTSMVTTQPLDQIVEAIMIQIMEVVPIIMEMITSIVVLIQMMDLITEAILMEVIILDPLIVTQLLKEMVFGILLRNSADVEIDGLKYLIYQKIKLV